MRRTEITVPVQLDEDTFRRYRHFDALVLHRYWLMPAALGAVAIVIGALTMAMKPEYRRYGAMLLAAGLALPALYFGVYLLRVDLQSKKLRLRHRPSVYTLRLREGDLRVENHARPDDAIVIPWPKMDAAYRVRDCIYLYTDPSQAFLLPAGQADAPQNEVWAYLINHMGSDNCINRQAA